MSIAMTLTFAIISPIMWLYAIVTGIGILAQGQVPVTGRRLWPERSRSSSDLHPTSLLQAGLQAERPPREWLFKRLTLDEIDRGEFSIELPSAPARYLRGDRAHAEWEQQIRRLVRDGDETWQYASPAEAWDDLAGRYGIALVRYGECVAHVVIAMN